MELYEDASSPVPSWSTAQLTPDHSTHTAAPAADQVSIKNHHSPDSRHQHRHQPYDPLSRPRMNYQRYAKPPYSYLGMIAMAILRSKSGRMTLDEIAQELGNMFPEFFKSAYRGWRDSVRHNLSRQDCFVKIPADPSKARSTRNYWCVDINQLPSDAFSLQVNSSQVYKAAWASDLRTQLGLPVPPVAPTFDETCAGNQFTPYPKVPVPEVFNLPLPFNIENILSSRQPTDLYPSPIASSSPMFRQRVSPGPDLRKDSVEDISSTFSSLESSPGQKSSTQSSSSVELSSQWYSSDSASQDSSGCRQEMAPHPMICHGSQYARFHSIPVYSTVGLCPCRPCQLQHQSTVSSSVQQHPAFCPSVIPALFSLWSLSSGYNPQPAHTHQDAYLLPYYPMAVPLPANATSSHSGDMFANTLPEPIQTIPTSIRYATQDNELSSQIPYHIHANEHTDASSSTQTQERDNTPHTIGPLTSTPIKANPSHCAQTDGLEGFFQNKLFDYNC